MSSDGTALIRCVAAPDDALLDEDTHLTPDESRLSFISSPQDWHWPAWAAHSSSRQSESACQCLAALDISGPTYFYEDAPTTGTHGHWPGWAGRMLGRVGMWPRLGDACDARLGGSGAGRGGCGRPALHALVSDLWTKDDGTRNSRAAQDGPVHFQSLNAGVSMRRAVVTAPGTCHHSWQLWIRPSSQEMLSPRLINNLYSEK